MAVSMVFCGENRKVGLKAGSMDVSKVEKLVDELVDH